MTWTSCRRCSKAVARNAASGEASQGGTEGVLGWTLRWAFTHRVRRETAMWTGRLSCLLLLQWQQHHNLPRPLPSRASAARPPRCCCQYDTTLSPSLEGWTEGWPATVVLSQSSGMICLGMESHGRICRASVAKVNERRRREQVRLIEAEAKRRHEEKGEPSITRTCHRCLRLLSFTCCLHRPSY